MEKLKQQIVQHYMKSAAPSKDDQVLVIHGKQVTQSEALSNHCERTYKVCPGSNAIISFLAYVLVPALLDLFA